MTGRNHSKGLGGRVSAVLARFRRHRHGAVAPILALALIPILGAMGIGAEVSNWWLVQRTAQNAADSAVLAAAIDAGNNMNGSTYPTATPTNNSCTTVPSSTESWYCQAISTAAGYSYTRSATVMVAPAIATCPNPGVNLSQCYQVSITKLVPIYLLGVLGFNGSDVVGGVKYQRITSTAYAAAPGPPVDFCLLTTDGDISASGTPNANILGCDSFSNGNSSCSGHGYQAGFAYASGSTASGTCTISGNGGHPNQQYQCDPYGSNAVHGQTFPDNLGNGGTFTETCSTSTNASSLIPADPGCTSPNSLTANSGSYPKANVITQASVSGSATGTGYANAVATTVNGVSMQMIQVCGNAVLGSGLTGGTTGSVNGCASTIQYTGSTPLIIVVYSGGLEFAACTLADNAPSLNADGTSNGGMTLIFAPPSEASPGQACPAGTTCGPVTFNSSGTTGVLEDAAPESGPFSGLAIMQSANYASDSGCPSGNSGHGITGVDFCNAGNSPTLDLQGLVYMPEADIAFAGAISKFQPNSLNCTGWIIKSFETNGTGSILDNNPLDPNEWPSSITDQCQQAGATLPGVPHTHTFYQALVG